MGQGVQVLCCNSGRVGKQEKPEEVSEDAASHHNRLCDANFFPKIVPVVRDDYAKLRPEVGKLKERALENGFTFYKTVQMHEDTAIKDAVDQLKRTMAKFREMKGLVKAEQDPIQFKTSLSCENGEPESEPQGQHEEFTSSLEDLAVKEEELKKIIEDLGILEADLLSDDNEDEDEVLDEAKAEEKMEDLKLADAPEPEERKDEEPGVLRRFSMQMVDVVSSFFPSADAAPDSNEEQPVELSTADLRRLSMQMVDVVSSFFPTADAAPDSNEEQSVELSTAEEKQMYRAPQHSPRTAAQIQSDQVIAECTFKAFRILKARHMARYKPDDGKHDTIARLIQVTGRMINDTCRIDDLKDEKCQDSSCVVCSSIVQDQSEDADSEASSTSIHKALPVAPTIKSLARARRWIAVKESSAPVWKRVDFWADESDSECEAEGASPRQRGGG